MNRRDRTAFESRARRACLKVACSDHGTRSTDVRFTWVKDGSDGGQVKVDLKIVPPPCCSKYDDAMYAACYTILGVPRPN